ncbi:hypothetical protein, variant 3 [Aphanomyces invadans]|nr:hypothetical protein, variant 2 [Aphanomyces invadans]XP_008866424.1 hypothetical protein, variant 3 [Aphanomyces invadans]ETW04985.1 hypothetical protein, variant 2 [Aphanomyces invadans]ETW04986.1 hypothetical protein, variant 3 [Aphanomyces invadans]|eukprot:XP_008866423.1 hypothetical protein, variant 2 [Aphanomyces invadans]
MLQKDNDDKSLQRYKENLLGAAIQGDLGDAQDLRRVVILQFKVIVEGNQQDFTYHLDTEEGLLHIRNTPFELEEGAKYKFAINFRVNREIVSGLRFHSKVRKHVFSTREEVVLGSFAPRSTTYEFLFPRHEWSEAPSGLLYRGTYHAECKFVDSDNVEHLCFPYSFAIKKVA